MLRSAKRRRSSGSISNSDLDENLHGLFAGINLDTNGRVAEINLVASSVHSSNDRAGHFGLFVRDQRQHQGR